jgi:hypothetical protein
MGFMTCNQNTKNVYNFMVKYSYVWFWTTTQNYRNKKIIKIHICHYYDQHFYFIFKY